MPSQLDERTAALALTPTQLELLKNLGSDAVSLVLEAISNGFSVQFALEVIQKLGSDVLAVINSASKAVTAIKMKATPDQLVEGIPVNMDAVVMTEMVKQLLATLLAKYGPQISAALLNFVTKLLSAGK